VYEGMTQYYGMILAARSGLWPQDFTLEEFAVSAAAFDRKRPGRSWRSLEDTTAQPITAARRPLPWVSWQRTEDYYQEGALLWLAVDARLREMSGGRRSLDDFARRFFAAAPTQGVISTYELADVVRTLNGIAAYDWETFLRDYVQGNGQSITDLLARAGVRLEFTDKPNATISDYEKAGGSTELVYSLGVTVSRDAMLTEVVWDSPAFKAGLTTNTTLVAVNGRAYSAEILKAAISRSGREGASFELLVRNQDRYRTVTVTCPQGLQYPHLVPIEGRTNVLRTLLAPAS
jgi:predicted metalloprotease with PDZ domain